MDSKNNYGNRIVLITRKEAETYFMNSIEKPLTPEDIMIRNEEKNTHQSPPVGQKERR